MLLPAPVRLSITICWPSVSLMWLPTRRAVMSAAEPGGKPMISRSGCDGNSPARATGETATAVSAKISVKISVRISAHDARRCMALLPLRFPCRVARFGDFDGIILCRRAARGDVAYWHMPYAHIVTRGLDPRVHHSSQAVLRSSASKTRVDALTTRGSIVLRKKSLREADGWPGQ